MRPSTSTHSPSEKCFKNITEIAGILTETVSWRMAFFVNVPVALLFLGLVTRFVPADPGSPDPKAKTVPLGRLAGSGAGIMLEDRQGLYVALLLWAFAITFSWSNISSSQSRRYH